MDGRVGALVYTEVTGMMCGLWMHPLAAAYPQNFQNPQTDMDNIPSVFFSRILFDNC